jgi:HSP20 family protein
MAFRNTPFEQMNSMMEQMRRSMLADFGTGAGTTGYRGWNADGVDTNVDVEETDEGYVVVADLPGFERADLTIRFDDGILTIRGENEYSDENGPISHRRSRRVFERLSFPGTVIEDDISASYHNGVLEVTLPVEESFDEDDAHVIDIE